MGRHGGAWTVEESWNCDDSRLAMGVATSPCNGKSSEGDDNDKMLCNDAAVLRVAATGSTAGEGVSGIRRQALPILPPSPPGSGLRW